MTPSHSTILLILGLGVTTCASAQEEPQPCRPTIVADVESLRAGDSLEVGILLTLDPHWHVYWHSPRDGGEGPRIDWDLPEGFRAGPIRWPVPERIIAWETMVLYAYEDEVLLKCQIETPKEWKGKAPIVATVHWQVCKEMCFYGEATLRTEVLAGDARRPSGSARLFEVWKDRYPLLRPPAGVKVDLSLKRDGDGGEWSVTWTLPDSSPGMLRDPSPPQVFPFDLTQGGISEAKIRIDPPGETPIRKSEARFQLDSLGEGFEPHELRALVTYHELARDPKSGKSGPVRRAFLVGEKGEVGAGPGAGRTEADNKRR